MAINNQKFSTKNIEKKINSGEIKGEKIKDFIEKTLEDKANKEAFDRLINK